jgi:hypothetical protein
VRTGLWRQFGAAIDMLDDAIHGCPDELWSEEVWHDAAVPGIGTFWYVAYHALFWLDYYVSGSPEDFAPPAPFGLSEFDPAGLLPPRTYSPDELRRYLGYGREKCRTAILSAEDDQLDRPCRVGRRELPYGELLLYTMRHVQEHAAQLNVFLGQRTGSAAGWVGIARGE